MSHRALPSRKIIVGDRGWNIEIVVALPMLLLVIGIKVRCHFFKPE